MNRFNTSFNGKDTRFNFVFKAASTLIVVIFIAIISLWIFVGVTVISEVKANGGVAQTAGKFYKDFKQAAE